MEKGKFDKSILLALGFLVPFNAAFSQASQECGQADVSVAFQNFGFLENFSCNATLSMKVGPSVEVESGSELRFSAPIHVIAPPFRVANGATVRFDGPLPARLNDTGIDYCFPNEATCPQASYPGQDGDFGRDITHHDDSDGRAGFSFSKIDQSGRALSAESLEWHCVLDNVTGLMWQVKTADGSLHDKDWTYTWFSSNPKQNGGYEGFKSGGNCVGSYCYTEDYVSAVNNQGLCGWNDWRLPSREELRSIVVYRTGIPVLSDENYFPGNTSGYYWSSQTVAIPSLSSQFAWTMYFGISTPVEGRYSRKNYDLRVRLVRDQIK